MQVKTAILTAQQTIQMGMTELPAPKADEVTIQPEYVGVCGSDVHFFEFGCIGACKVEYPFVLGHECAGVVTAVGSDVDTLRVGDRVTIEPGIPCGRCKFCREGRYNLCRQVKFLSTPPYDGVLRERFNHPADLTYRLPENVSTKDGALMEPLAVGAYACKRGGVHPGSRVAILGGGCIGLMTLLACKAAGAAQIVVSDLFDLRLDKAKQLGATGVFNPKTDGDTAALREKFTAGAGFDVVFETAGNRVTAAQTSELVGRGGVIVVVGNVLGEVAFSFRNLYLNEAEVRAVFRYRNMFPEIIQQVAAGRIDVSGVASDVFSFDDTQTAFERAMNNKAEVVKAVIKL